MSFRGGATQTLTLPAALQCWQMVETDPETVQMIDSLLNQSTDEQVAAILNQRGVYPGKGGAFRSRIIANLRRVYGLKNHYDRLRQAAMLTVGEMAERLSVSEYTIKKWRRVGLLRGFPGNDKGVYLFESPDSNAPPNVRDENYPHAANFLKLKCYRLVRKRCSMNHSP